MPLPRQCFYLLVQDDSIMAFMHIDSQNETVYLSVPPDDHAAAASGVTTPHILLKVYILNGSEYNSPL